MSINLEPELEELVRRKVASGEFPSAEAVVKAALRGLDAGSSIEGLLATHEQRAANLVELFDEVDREPPPRETPLPDEAFDRENLYDDRA